MKKRLKAVFRGQVQGVGFRWECVRMAEGWGLVGWVKNMPDGSVVLVAEGNEVDLQFFLDDLGGFGLSGGIDERLLAWGPALHGFVDFVVRYH